MSPKGRPTDDPKPAGSRLEFPRRILKSWIFAVRKHPRNVPR